MKWTEPSKPINGISYYDHVILESPMGKIIIEWKSWKERPSYSIELGGLWIGAGDTLDEAKEIAETYLMNMAIKIKEFLDDLER